ncbi:DUF4249 family protein [Saccharicrinis sp. 156]|uniref:DUF4249 family protein n=1 Tax=Saccharicrinis sp. 156 TaxID=3417574 RepID=UPI003D3421D8
MKFTIIVVLAWSLLFSCIENRELPYNGLLAEPGYFIECYLVPNDRYKLTATKLQPLYDDYILDYSLEFDVRIDTLKLWQGLFRENNSDYVFNYRHSYRFEPSNKTSIDVQVITPEMDTVVATTTIPEEIDILNEKRTGDDISFGFELSEQGWHNYFMININTAQKDTTFRKVRFLDYSHMNTRDTVNINYTVLNSETFDRIEIILRRITKANYDYQISLENAKDANSDNLILPSPLAGNLKNATGIFTCFTRDSVVWNRE